MNANTKALLKDFISELQIMSVGAFHLIGLEGVKKLVEAGDKLKEALEKDETIL